MIAMCFLRCFLVFGAVFSVFSQASVISESPIIAQLDQCHLSCGTRGQLPLTEIEGSLYYFHVDDTKKKNWFESYNFCKEHDMELVTIETAEENEAIRQKIIALRSDESYWIGLNDLGKEGEFRWASTGRVARFTNWHRGEPNNKERSEHCVHFFKKSDGFLWNDEKCSKYTVRFICKVAQKNLLYMHAN